MLYEWELRFRAPEGVEDRLARAVAQAISEHGGVPLQVTWERHGRELTIRALMEASPFPWTACFLAISAIAGAIGAHFLGQSVKEVKEAVPSVTWPLLAVALIPLAIGFLMLMLGWLRRG